MPERQPGSAPSVTVHLETPSIARVHDYYLGGTANWEVDRAFGDEVLDRFPLMRRIVFAHRLFLNRAVRHMVRQGIRQFLDVGSGVPNAGATHDVADELARETRRPPETRVVYVDNDPVAVAHTELLLDARGDRCRHAVVDADLRDPDALWQLAVETELLEPAEPVGLLLIGLLHLRQPDAEGQECVPAAVAKLRELLPMGSFVAISHVSDDGVPEDVGATLAGLKELLDRSGSGDVHWRSRCGIRSLLGDLRLVDPGWLPATEWRPEETGPSARTTSLPCEEIIWAGVGRKG
ncbi:SAM-dependent methyltransferase [Actinophytocola xanthii]|uniref:Methyltransferase n=1 Tax=Actinophytocola xanthii TaxID=1912961 RepID=A0A1Q8CLE1_9PSEU|nr:SAM-dependent methyltransferase [Actinophytocola xanthii]OLF15170.1 hypothetical protein BU204_23180 [Actinophytocola xanthii]